jgi:hypothetical protein
LALVAEVTKSNNTVHRPVLGTYTLRKVFNSLAVVAEVTKSNNTVHRPVLGTYTLREVKERLV